MSDQRGGGRISWLDGWRGAALYIMVVYHLLFDAYMFGWVGWDLFLSVPMVLLEKLSAYSFILCAGISSTLTRSNVKRGLVTLAAGAVVTAASYLVDAPIRFGVLQFLGLAMLVYALVGKGLKKIPEKLAPILWVALFIFFHILTERVLVDTHWLFWLGFRYAGYVSYDHFPMLPYIFLFFLGGWLGGVLQSHGDRFPILARTAPEWLAWPGRHSLWIYLIHQPMLYGVCWILSKAL